MLNPSRKVRFSIEDVERAARTLRVYSHGGWPVWRRSSLGHVGPRRSMQLSAVRPCDSSPLSSLNQHGVIFFVLILGLLGNVATVSASPQPPPQSDANVDAATEDSASSNASPTTDSPQQLVYKQVNEVALKLDVYKPMSWQASDRRGAIVFFFGGGWRGGSTQQFAPQCKHLAGRGMVAIAAEYRVESRHGVSPAECVADAIDAMRWVRRHASQLGVDSARIAAAGGSAGGHLAAATAVLGPRDPSDSEVNCEPNALVLFNPVIDTTHLGYGGRRLGDQMFALSPVHHVRKRMAPTLIFHGDEDTTVPLENVQRFKRVMDEAGNACQVVVYPGAKHGFFNLGRPKSEYEDTLKRTDRFLTQLGFLPPESASRIAGRNLKEWKAELLANDPTRARRAAESLGQFGPLASACYEQMLTHDDPAIRFLGARHLGDHQTPNSAMPRLRKMMEDDTRSVRIATAYALFRLSREPQWLTELETFLFVPDRGAVCTAAELLGRIGPPAHSLLEKMQEERAHQNNGGDYHKRGALDNAIRKIRQDQTLVQHQRPQGGGQPRGWTAKQAARTVPPQNGDRPNILWISCEDISPNLGCYGDDYARTPNLDALAAEGARFTHAFTPAGVCAVVRSGLITGVYPISQGSQHMRSNIVPPTGVKCFTEYLREAGYFCTNKSKTDYQFAAPKSAWDRQGNQHADWREREPGQPFFSVINLTISHESQIRHGDKTHAAILRLLQPSLHHNPVHAAPFLPSIYANTPETRKDWARYADNISEMDRQVGLILSALEADGLADNTLVVFWSDHGRGLPRGKRWIYDSGVHIPMIARWPGHVARATTRDDLVSTQDLAPTMLATAGVQVPTYMQGRVFLGAETGDEPEFLFFHRDRMDELYELMRAARDKRYKYIRNYRVEQTYAEHIEYMDKMPTLVDLRRLHSGGHLNPAQAHFFRTRKAPEELYDLQLDPDETVNLAWMPEHAERRRRMREALERWQEQIVDLGFVPEPIMMEQMMPID